MPTIDLIETIGLRAWDTYLVLAPLFLLGLLIAGLLHIMIPRRTIDRLMGGQGIGSVVSAAAFGMPLPLCSCGVVPVTLALRGKGASKPAAISFLITTPETGADSLMVTWAMLGPVMTVVRPLASFATAIVAGVAAIIFLGDRDSKPNVEGQIVDDNEHCHQNLIAGDEEEFLGWKGLIRSIWPRFGAGDTDKETVPLRRVVALIFQRGFVDIIDETGWNLLIGVLLAGVIIALLPADLAVYGLGGGIASMLAMILVGVPLYMCASASTPIAAALVAKGVSPGAALVFLLTGPATNLPTILMLGRQLGAPFLSVYLGGIIGVSVVAGLALDFALLQIGLELLPNLGGQESDIVAWFEWGGALVLGALVTWRLARSRSSRDQLPVEPQP